MNTAEAILKEALIKISKWELPETGEYWGGNKQRPISYEANYGSNGVRDYFMELASQALLAASQSQEAPDKHSEAPIECYVPTLGESFKGMLLFRWYNWQEKHQCSWDTKNAPKDVSELIDTIVETIKEYGLKKLTLSSSPAVGDWISVEEKGYPEHNVGVLVFIPDEDYHITSGMWDISNKWVLLDEYRKPDCKVTHWMPLVDIPNEYRKERDKGNEAMGFLKKYLPKK